MASQQPLNAPLQAQMTGGALDQDVQANLCCPSAISACVSCVCFPCWLGALKTIDQNQHAAVMVWGEYVGSVTQPGLVIVNPVGTELKTISTARQTMDIKELKVKLHDPAYSRKKKLMLLLGLHYKLWHASAQDMKVMLYRADFDPEIIAMADEFVKSCKECAGWSRVMHGPVAKA